MREHDVHRGSDRTRPIGSLLAGLVVMAVVAAGCGDDSVEAVSKDDYIAQANAICATTNDVVDAEFEEFWATAFADLPDGSETAEEPQTVFEAMDAIFDDAITPSVEEQIAELRALGAPEGDAETLAALYDDLQIALEDYNSSLDDAVAGDADAMESVGSGSAEGVFDDVDRRARDYGLTVCGEQDE
jgi:hypothetical protein